MYIYIYIYICIYLFIYFYVQILHTGCVYSISFKPEKSPLVRALVLLQYQGPRLGTCDVVARHRIFGVRDTAMS